MKGARVWLLLAVLMTAPAMTSCWPFRKAKKPAPPPPPQPVQAQAPAAQPISSKPPELSPGEVPVSPPPKELPTTAQPVPPTMPPKKRPSPMGPPVQPATAPPPTPTPAPAPQLRQILSPQQQQELNRLISQRIGRASQILASLAGRSLARDQAATVNQIRTFIQQARDAQKDDLVRAGNLAERADVLAQDLRSRLR